jgi:hypothetical protein
MWWDAWARGAGGKKSKRKKKKKYYLTFCELGIDQEELVCHALVEQQYH